MNVEVDFTGVTNINAIVIRAYYDGMATHAVRAALYNYNDTAWDVIHTLNDGRDYEQHFKAIPDDTDYISGGNAIIRFYHNESGNTSHHLYLDYVSLRYTS